MTQIPILYNDYDTWMHRRDPRAKILMFAALTSVIYVAPTWEWMAALAVVGLGLAALARVHPKWLAALWAIQIPNLLGIVAFPAAQRMLAGRAAMAGSFDVGLKLAFSWTAATFVFAGVVTTMRVTEFTDALRGLKVPEFVCFTIEYIFLLLYVVLDDVYRIADAMKAKGVALESRHPVRLLRAVPKLAIPSLFAVLRRSNTMMGVLKMRGYPLDDIHESRTELRFGAGDAALVAAGVGVFAVAALANFGVVSVPVLPS
ncbi:MAG: energy-coupling factor transporter transmembrane protein EcfT [Halobacterium sp.]